LDLRADARRRYVGRSARPGAPPIEAEQTLDSFRASPRAGWTLLHRLSVGALFLALAILLPHYLRRRWQAALGVVTLGLVLWAIVYDSTHPCNGDDLCLGGGLATLLAVVVSVVAWAVALGVAALLRRVR